MRVQVCAAVVALISVAQASPGALAQEKPDAARQAVLMQRLMSELACKPGQLCEEGAAGSRTRSLTGRQGPAVKLDLNQERIRRNVEIAAKSGKVPAADVEVYFPYNSAELVSDTRLQLETIAAALRSTALVASQFAIVGHTDAKGTDPFNLTLSERRAAAVRGFLQTTGQIAPERLSAWGRGKRELKNAREPFSGENRRVQLINIGKLAAAAPPATSPAPAAKSDCRQYSPRANTTTNCEN